MSGIRRFGFRDFRLEFESEREQRGILPENPETQNVESNFDQI
jgi:hypothetical protein